MQMMLSCHQIKIPGSATRNYREESHPVYKHSGIKVTIYWRQKSWQSVIWARWDQYSIRDYIYKIWLKSTTGSQSATGSMFLKQYIAWLLLCFFANVSLHQHLNITLWTQLYIPWCLPRGLLSLSVLVILYFWTVSLELEMPKSPFLVHLKANFLLTSPHLSALPPYAWMYTSENVWGLIKICVIN